MCSNGKLFCILATLIGKYSSPMIGKPSPTPTPYSYIPYSPIQTLESS